METLEFIKKAEDGKIIIDVPENLKGKDLKITLTEAVNVIAQSSANEKTSNIMKYYGTANYPEIDLEKFNVYEQ